MKQYYYQIKKNIFYLRYIGIYYETYIMKQYYY